MTLYNIYLTKRFQIRATIKEVDESRLITTIDLDTNFLAPFIIAMQDAVDNTLMQLDAIAGGSTKNLN